MAPPPGNGAQPANASAPQIPAMSTAATAVQTESPANTAPSSNAAATDTATSGLRIAGQASMVTGKPRAPYPRGLTNRLRALHPDLNAVRETLHHSPQNAGENAPE